MHPGEKEVVTQHPKTTECRESRAGDQDKLHIQTRQIQADSQAILALLAPDHSWMCTDIAQSLCCVPLALGNLCPSCRKQSGHWLTKEISILSTHALLYALFTAAQGKWHHQKTAQPNLGSGSWKLQP